MPDDNTDIWIVYSTFPNRGEALFAANILLEKRLIACGNIIDHVTSVYRWEGEKQQSAEVVLIAKTSKEKAQAAIEEIHAVHSYQMPCAVAFPVSIGLPEFLQWVATDVA